MDFLNRISKKAQISRFIKIRPVGAELFRADGQVGMTKLTVAFRNFANALKNWLTSKIKKFRRPIHYTTCTTSSK